MVVLLEQPSTKSLNPSRAHQGVGSEPLFRGSSRRLATAGGVEVEAVATDLELLERAQQGDEDAFGELVQRHTAGVFRVAAGMVGRDEADDVVQEVFLRALTGLGRFEGRSAVRTWLFGIANRVSLQKLRSRRRWGWLKRLGERDPVGPERGAGGFGGKGAEDGERAAAIAAALSTLPDHQRAVVVLRAYEGLSYQEIATTLGIQRPTAESRMARARQTLRQELGSWLEGAE